MPDLGKYAFVVLVAYVGSIGLIAAMIYISIARYRKAMRELVSLEDRPDA